jgi:ubiquinone/menaquinone biosynthesis C-methylase UbiE
MTSLHDSYDEFPRIEDAFQAALDQSLHPRGPDLLFDIVGELALPRGASVIDLGCGDGEEAITLATRFGLDVHGVDPVPRNLEVANQALSAAPPAVRERVRFEPGAAESIPAADASVDLIWCRESLYFFDLDAAFAECRRVLRPGGRMLIYSNFATERMEPAEAASMWNTLETVPANSDPRHVEAAITRAGFEIERNIELGTQFGEYAAEHTGKPQQQLVHAARLLREPARYVAEFGRKNYDIMLADAVWHVYRMIGKLSSRIYLLKVP